MHKEQIVLLFVKDPARGVKARLAADVGVTAATEIYRNFVLDTISMLQTSGYPFRICFYPPSSERDVAGWLGSGYEYMPQKGNDLGERMGNAFSRIFSEGFRHAVLVGSDIPDLDRSVIISAFSELRNHDVVLGPAVDGGYYLIGLNRQSYLPDLFRGIRWSTNTVLRDTLDLLGAASRQVHLLPGWSDVDSLEDLKALYSRNSQTDFKRSRTMSYLGSSGKHLVKADDKTE